MAVEGGTRAVAFGDVRSLRVPWRKVLVGVLALFGVVAAAFVTTNTYAVIWQRHLDGRWAEMVAAGAPGAPAVGDPVAKMLIPDIGAELVVLEGGDRSTLRRGPGHVPGSPLPGDLGNAVIRGHRLLWSGPFRDIDRLDYGSRILVQTLEGQAVYLVAGIFHQDEDRTDLYEDTSLPFLTLVTSDPPFRAHRFLVVRAVMIELNGAPL